MSLPAVPSLSRAASIAACLFLFGCSGLSREYMHTFHGRGVVKVCHTWSSWEHVQPSFTLWSESGDVHVHIQGDGYGRYDVLMGPAIAWGIPLFLVSWLWYEPIDEESVEITIDVFGSEGHLQIIPRGMELHRTNGSRIPPTAVELVKKNEYLPCYCNHARRSEFERFGIGDYAGSLVARYDLSEVRGEPLRLFLEGISSGTQRQTFTMLTLRAGGQWMTWAEPH